MNIRWEKLTANILGGFLILLTITVVLIFAVPINVLRDWHIKTDKATYAPTDTIHVQSSSTKLRKASGDVNRTIECDSGRDSVVAYNLNVSEGSRKPGFSFSTYNLEIPDTVANLPATCRVVVSVKYQVLFIRHVVEYAVSNNFTISRVQ